MPQLTYRLLLLLFVPLFLRLPPASYAAASSPSGPHIAEVNILLPPKMTHPVEYRLRGSDGCFTWSWDHHDILSVIPKYNTSSHCSTSAQLKSIAPYSGRKETSVYATDVHTGMVIRCKVYVDNLSRIQIFHNSIKLDLEGLATLRVRAFDNQDNEFTSLVGLRFSWQLSPETGGSPHHLVHVPLKDSPLSDCGGLCNDLNLRSRLENTGEFSDLFVVKGTEIGQESVAVRLLEPFHEHMTDRLTLTVAEAMSLDPPSPVVTLIGAVVRFTLKVIRGNTPQAVPLPSPHHEWSVVNSSVARVDATTGVTRALNLGATTVSVEDTRVAGHIQISSLHVVVPDTLSLFLLPLSLVREHFEGVASIPSAVRWYVVSGREYLVHMKVFAGGPAVAREVFITETDNLKLNEDHSEHWDTLPPSSDGFSIVNSGRSSRILKATSRGLGKLAATLAYSRGLDQAKEVLKVTQEIMVCGQATFASESRNVLLPWVPGVHQELELEVTGGCGSSSTDYKWFSSDMATVSVSASGILEAKRPGNATVKVASIYDSLNYDEIEVEVSVPSSLIMLPDFPVETVVGSHIPAAVTMQAPNGAYFDKCDAFKSFIRWDTGSDAFLFANATAKSLVIDEQLTGGSLYGPPCSWILLYASTPGRTLLYATLKKEYHDFDRSAGGSIGLKSSAHIAAYFPLIMHQAGDGNRYGGYWFDLSRFEIPDQLENVGSLFLAPSTHMDVMLRGGPEPWDQAVEYVETVETFDEEDGRVNDAVRVLRTSAGPYSVSCLQSGTFKLVFRRGNLAGKNHPLPAVAVAETLLVCRYPSTIVLTADEPVNAPAVIKSEIEARRGSRRVRAGPITVANGRSIRVSAVGVSGSGEPFANSSSLRLRWETIDCDELAIWDDFYSANLAKSSWDRVLILRNSSGLCTVRATVTESGLTDAIPLQIVSTLRVTPEHNLLLFSPEAKLNLSVFGGSCFLDSTVNDTRIVDVTDLQCSQLILTPKRLGTALVTVRDTLLSPPISASSVIRVADIDWIKIVPGDEISIMDGNSRSIDLLAGVDDGCTFDSSQYVFMNIRVHVDDDVVDVVEGEYVNSPSFAIRARRLGVTTLYVSVRQQSGHEVTSQPIKIEVYASPTLHPGFVFLVPGASYVVTVDGGPTIGGAHIEFAATGGETAAVAINATSGRLSAVSPGNMTVIARFYGNDDRIVCEAYGNVTVGVPISAVLGVQSKQLAIGREMPVFPLFSEGNLFSFYELCRDYEWVIDDENVLSFGGGQELGFIRVVNGKSPGRTNVSVSFSCDSVPSGSFSRSYAAYETVSVVPDLPLALGPPITWLLMPHYTTSNLLPSSSSRPYVKYSLLKEKTEDGEDDGIFIDGGKIKTTESNHLACIQAKDRATGRTAVASCVRVADVNQIRIRLRFRSIHLAIGSELDLPISYCDDLGNPFHEAYNAGLFGAETNYGDVVTIGGAKDGIRLTANGHGRALVRVSLRNDPEKSDYVLVSVGAHEEMVVTSVVTVGAPEETTLTNAPFPAKGYGFPVRFDGGYAAAYDCKVDPPFVGSAKPWWNLDTGGSYCLFFPYSPEHLVLAIPNGKDTRREISVTVTASFAGAGHVSGSASARFVGGFSVLGIDPTSLQLNLTPESNVSIVTVVGNTDVNVHWRHHDRVLITPVLHEENGIRGRKQYEIRALKRHPFVENATFTLVGNNQRLEITIVYETGETRAPTKPARLVWAGVLGVFTLLASVSAAFIWFLDRPERVLPPPAAATAASGPVTPDRRNGSSGVTGESSSPRTPQPFVEYLRRTIDETPYYRTEVRRRVNPQNTF